MPCVSSTMLTTDSAHSTSPQAARTRSMTCLTVYLGRSPAISMLESRIRPTGLIPRRRIARLAVADDLFKVGGEAGIHDRLVAQFFGVLLGQSDGLRQQAPARFDCLAQHDGGLGILFDDDLLAQVGAGQQTADVADRFGFQI